MADTHQQGKRRKIKTEPEEGKVSAIAFQSNTRAERGATIDDHDDEVKVVDPPPQLVTPVKSSEAAAAADDDDIQVVATRHSHALPHMRPHCTVHVFQTEEINVDASPESTRSSPNRQACRLCYCYVCDRPVRDCQQWGEHCDATDKSTYWAQQRMWSKAGIMEARLKEARFFKRIVHALKQLTANECCIECDQSGMSLQAMHPHHVSLLELSLPSAAFSHYNCTGALKLSIPSIHDIARGLVKAKKCDTLNLKAAGGRLMFTFENTKTPSKAPAPFHVVLMDPPIAAERLIIPATIYKCTVRMSSSLFQKIVQDLYLCCDVCSISCAPMHGIRFTALRKAHDVQPGCIQKASYLVRSNAGMGLDDEDMVTILCDEPVEEEYDLGQLISFTKATPLSPIIYISMSPDVPLKIEYPLGGMNEGVDSGCMQFYLAPKFDDDSWE
jgi:proliferating cell nuclear antigen